MAQRILEKNKGNIGLTDFKFLFSISSKKDKATQIQLDKMKKSARNTMRNGMCAPRDNLIPKTMIFNLVTL